MNQSPSGNSPRLPEFIFAIVILLSGLVPRILAITLFPTRPYSDFKAIIDFALLMMDSGFAAHGWYWEFFNPGLPVFLSLIFRIVPGNPDAIARSATAILMGFLPLIPYLTWRGVLNLRTRTLAGMLLALWPGQILFSGVVAQDNWVLVPTVALASLAVRSLILQKGGYPVPSALLFALATYIRQEMFIVLIPLAIVSAGFGNGRPVREFLIWVILAAMLFTAMAGQRFAATGRFSLTTEHGGRSVLGAYAPGAGADLWTDPAPFISSVDPSLLEDKKRLQKESFSLVVQEVLQRPQFHAVRMIFSVLGCLIPDVALSYWSMGNEALDRAYHEKASVFIKKVTPWLNGWLLILHAAFFASFFLGIVRRNRAIIIITATLLLKISIHAVLASQPRYYISVIALEILVIVLGADAIRKEKEKRKEVYLFLTSGIVAAAFLFGLIAPLAKKYVLTNDDLVQRIYRFKLAGPGNTSLSCVVDHGRIRQLFTTSVQLELLHADPPPGEIASAKCRLTGSGAPVPLVLQVLDPYAPGGFPDRIAQRVTVDGIIRSYHDIAAEPGSGWYDIPVGPIGLTSDKTINIEIVAVRPDPGPAWGSAANTTFRLAVDNNE